MRVDGGKLFKGTHRDVQAFSVIDGGSRHHGSRIGIRANLPNWIAGSDVHGVHHAALVAEEGERNSSG